MSMRRKIGAACLVVGLASAGYADILQVTPFYGGRSESGETTLRIDSDGFWQVELQTGAIFAF